MLPRQSFCDAPENAVVCPADRKLFSPSVANTNRINLDQDTDNVNDYAFVAAGNTTRDAGLRRFTYDAENKQANVETVNSSGTVTGTIGEYFYDGDGRRVKKIAYSNNQVTETTVFVYNASSRLVAEYSTNLNPTPQVAYLTADHLGSPRINTDENGKVTARHDYRPYGEEVTERTHAQYAGDTIRKQFTSHEKDNESDLNYAKARYQNPNHGRFTSPDPARMTKARMADPQHWNLYVYARNNPILLVDVTGEFPWTFYIRSFIYTSAVGPGGCFRGDGRTPSLETDPNKASSRVRLSFTFDYDRGQITSPHVESDPTVLYCVRPTAEKGKPGVEFGNVETSNRSRAVSLHYWGKDPITPGFATPDLDVHASIGITESKNKDGTGKLFIAGTFTGDKFPSTEAFIVDQSGKTKLFLGAKLEEGGVSDLYGDNKQDLFKVDIQVRFDKKGNFTAVIQDGKTYTVDEWNKRVQAQF